MHFLIHQNESGLFLEISSHYVVSDQSPADNPAPSPPTFVIDVDVSVVVVMPDPASHWAVLRLASALFWGPAMAFIARIPAVAFCGLKPEILLTMGDLGFNASVADLRPF